MMKIGVNVGDVMTRKFVSVKPETSISQCAKEMITKKVGSLIVRENQHIKGILTEGDIIKSLSIKKDLGKIKAQDVMTRNPMTISPSDDIYNALLKMRGKQIRWLPVTVKGMVIGMLTVKDILRIEPSLFELVSQYTPIKEESEKLKAIALRKKSKAAEKGETWSREGECDECGAYGLLYNSDGELICEECRDAG